MPKVKLNKQRVLKLIGKHITDKELNEKIPYLGTDLEEITDEIINVEIFPNRPDLLSEEGFARGLSAFLGIKTGLKQYKTHKSTYEVKITKEVKNIREYAASCVAKNLKLNEEKLNNIIEIQEKLHITFGRNRKKVAIGIYPLNVIQFPITYTAKPPKEIIFQALGDKDQKRADHIIKEHQKGKEYAHLLEGQKKYPVWHDSKNQVLSLAPIINSEITGKVTENTTEVFIEATGPDYKTLEQTINIIATALIDMGADIYEVKLNYETNKEQKTTPNFQTETIKTNKQYIEK